MSGLGTFITVVISVLVVSWALDRELDGRFNALHEKLDEQSQKLDSLEDAMREIKRKLPERA